MAYKVQDDGKARSPFEWTVDADTVMMEKRGESGANPMMSGENRNRSKQHFFSMTCLRLSFHDNSILFHPPTLQVGTLHTIHLPNETPSVTFLFFSSFFLSTNGTCDHEAAFEQFPERRITFIESKIKL